MGGVGLAFGEAHDLSDEEFEGGLFAGLVVGGGVGVVGDDLLDDGGQGVCAADLGEAFGVDDVGGVVAGVVHGFEDGFGLGFGDVAVVDALDEVGELGRGEEELGPGLSVVGSVHESGEFADHPVGDFFGEVLGGGLRECADGVFEPVGGCGFIGEESGFEGGQGVVALEAGASVFGEFGELRADGFDVVVGDLEWWEVGFGEVSVVVGGFFGALGEGDFAGFVPAAGFLWDGVAIAEEVGLALDFEFECALDAAEGVHVFDFDFCAELGLSARSEGDIGVAAEGAFFHVGGADVEVAEDLSEFDEVGAGFVGAAEVGFGDDFHEWDAGAVDVDEGVALAGFVVAVEESCGVFFEVDAGDADASLAKVVGVDVEPALLAEGHVVLGDLVALHEVWVGVVFAVEFGECGDGHVEGESGADGPVDGGLVDDGEGAGHAQAERADEGVGVGVGVVGGAVAEHFGVGAELAVDFQSDDGF